MTRAATPEPPPTGEGTVILDLVLDDLKARAIAGALKYGTLLRAGNGRDALMDAYQEALDLAMYLRQEMQEQLEGDCADSACDRRRRQLQAALTDGVEERRKIQARTLERLQAEQRDWSARNFPGRDSWEPLVGVGEELGELNHAHLKAHQGIRTNEDHEAKGKDAVGDIVIYLADYCTAKGWSFEECVFGTWAVVKQRDWKADPETGEAA